MKDFYGGRRAYARKETGDGLEVVQSHLHCKCSNNLDFLLLTRGLLSFTDPFPKSVSHPWLLSSGFELGF
jgi:hypothetical protein